MLLKETGLQPALDALGEEHPITVQAPPGRRYPEATESSVYLLVARMSAAGPTSVVINDDGTHLTTRVTVNGHPSDLLDLTDRAKTLGGGIEITDREMRSSPPSRCHPAINRTATNPPPRRDRRGQRRHPPSAWCSHHCRNRAMPQSPSQGQDHHGGIGWFPRLSLRTAPSSDCAA